MAIPYSFHKYCITNVTKLVLIASKSVSVVTTGFTKLRRSLIVKIKFLKFTVKTSGFAAIAWAFGNFFMK